MIHQDLLFHDGTRQFCRYKREEKTYEIILRAKKGTITGAFVCVNGEEKNMQLRETEERFEYYAAVLDDSEKMYSYYFKVFNGQDVIYFNMLGISSEVPEEGKFELTSGFDTPDWAKGAVMYQIMVDRFCNGDTSNDVVDNEYVYIGKGVSAIKDWNEIPAADGTRQFYGGDLQGVIDKLDYLQKLGVEVIYFNPLFVSPSNHKYDTTDYTKIDPSFGDGDTMKVLCKEAHEKGIRIMVDAVFNHCGRKFAPWMDVLKNGKNSRYADWFMVENWEQIGKRADTRDRRFYSFAFSDGMPKLNTNNEEVIQYFCKICEDWIRDYDIDGIRFDVGNEVSHRFLKRIREHLKKIKPDIYLLGEIWHDASQWLLGDEYDSVMNYPLLSGIHDFFLDQTMKKEEFEYMVNRCYTMYMQQNNNVLFNLLDSHDTERLINRLHNLDIFYQQLAILFTLPGSPCIYYGTEIAMEGAHDPDCRRCMPWSEIESDENQERIGTINRLIMLRRNEKTCRSPHFHFPNTYENGRCVEYVKIDEEGNKIEVLLNASNENVKVKGEGEILFARKFDGDILGANGTLIRKIGVTIQ